MITLNQKAAKIIKSLMRQLSISDHLIFSHNEKAISANSVIEELEQSDLNQRNNEHD